MDESTWRQQIVGPLALTPFELHVPVTDQVGIADLGGRGLIQRHRTIDIELHPNPTATVDQV